MSTLSDIRETIEDKQHWKKGDEWWADYLGVPLAKIKEARGTLDTANADDYDDYDNKENHQNQNKNRANKNKGTTAHQDQTLEEYCESIGLDPDMIDRYNDVKYWTDAAGNRRYSIVPKNLEEDIRKEDLIEAIREYTPPAISVEPPLEVKMCGAIINFYDAHFDKVSQIGEGYTIEDNMDLLRRGFAKMIRSLKYHNPKEVYIPIGNDFFDTNDFRNTTRKGTPQELSVHWKESFQLGIQLIREFIDMASAVTEKVIVVPIEGNHDEDKVFYLNEAIKIAYENIDRVHTMHSSSPRHYHRFGKNLLGFGHGKIEKKKLSKMGSIVPLEAPQLWGSTTHRYMFLGDIHTREEHRFMRTQDQEGLTVHFFRDIGLTHSTWDRQEAFHKGKKSMEVQIVGIDGGITDNHIFNV